MNKNEANIIRWILLLPIAGVLLSSFLLTNIFISSKYTSHDNNIEYIENNYIENLKNKIKERVENLSFLLSNNFTTKKEALDFISKINFADNSYIFAIDKNKTTLVHKNKQLENVPFDSIDDEKIQGTITKIIQKALSEGSSYIEYKQSEKIFKDFKQSKKISFVKYIPKYDFIIGTGLYTDDLRKQIEIVDKNLETKLGEDIQSILLISLLITGSVIFLLLYLSRRLKNIFNFYSKKLEQSNQKLLNLNNELEDKVQEQLTVIREKDFALNQQSKMAAMGEMLGNIAHQWRQPLSAISTIASGLKLKREMGDLSESNLEDDLENIVQTTVVLSNTIDDFRNFYSRNKEETEFLINKTMQKVLNLVSANLKNNNIELVLDIEKNALKSYENELIQVLLNVINNAKDALLNIKEERYIFITSYKKDKTLRIKIYDNAGGIDEKTLPRIYEPYFTTKFKSQGTGIGLYMSKNIVENNLKGKISTSNFNFNYENKTFFGAMFEISLPLK